MKIGFFGGCFNPPTNAHINLAKKVLKKCDIDKIIFVPVGDFYRKNELASEKDRYNMLKIAIRDSKNLEVSDLELNRKEKLYATDIFKIIEEKYLGNDIFFIMGADNFINIAKWKNAQELIEKYSYIILSRKNIEIEKYINEDEIIKKYKSKIQIVENDNYISSSATEFRDKVRDYNEYNQEIVPDEVIDYIIENGLYK